MFDVRCSAFSRFMVPMRSRFWGLRAAHERERGCPTRSSFAGTCARKVRRALLSAMRCGWDSRAPFKSIRLTKRGVEGWPSVGVME
jgi:hypothetical protein